MTETAALINSIATLLAAVAWPLAMFSIVALLRQQIVELISRVENLNMGDKSIKFRLAAITGVTEAVEQLAESHELDAAVESTSPIDDIMKELVEDDPREAILRQWDRVQRALTNLAARHGLDIDLRSMHRTALVLKGAGLISDELGAALEELYKSCKYARRVYEFDLPQETVEDYVRATNDAIGALKKV
jgi:hypothetical protein